MAWYDVALRAASKPKLAASNAYSRASQAIGPGSGFAYNPGKWDDAIKAAFTPFSAQQAQAADSSQSRLEYLNKTYGPSATTQTSGEGGVGDILVGGGDGGTGGGGTTVGGDTWWMGQKYNWNDPTQRQNYINARKGYIEDIYGRSKSGVTQSIGNLDTSKADYLEDWQSQVDNLGRNKEKRLSGLNSWYSAIAPNMYQSSQTTNIDEANRIAQEGVDLAGRQKERSLTSFDQQRGALNQSLSDLDTQKLQEMDSINQTVSNQEADDAAARIRNSASSKASTYTPVEKMLGLADYSDKLGLPVGSQAWNQATNQYASRQGYQLTDTGAAANFTNAYSKFKSAYDTAKKSNLDNPEQAAAQVVRNANPTYYDILRAQGII